MAILDGNPRIKLSPKEIAPFSPFSARAGGIQLLSNPDMVLTTLAMSDERAWLTMERSEPVIYFGKQRRVSELLAVGSEIVAANRMPAARLLADWSIALLKGIPQWQTVQKKFLDGVFWGWRPSEVIPTFDRRFKGKPYWMISAIREKKPWDFRFTTDRDLVWVGSGMSEQIVFNQEDEEDRLRWVVCTSGSTDNPHGEAIYPAAWLVHYIKQRFVKMWAKGIQRSMGIPVFKQTAGSPGASFGPGGLAAPAGPGAAKTLTEITAEVAEALRELDDSGVLVQRYGWIIEMVSDIGYADGWLGALEYLDKMMNLCITGDVLSLAQGQVGSRAAKETTRQELQSLAKGDGQTLTGWVNGQIIIPWINLNHPNVDPDDLPKFRMKLGSEPTAENIVKLYNMGFPIDGKRVAEELGVSIILDPQPDDLIIQKQQPTFEQQLQLAATRFGAGQPPGAPGGPGQLPPKKPGAMPPPKKEGNPQGDGKESKPKGRALEEELGADASMELGREEMALDLIAADARGHAERYLRALTAAHLEANPDPLV